MVRFRLFGWRFVFGIIMRWEGREPYQSDVITTWGSSIAASLLLLSSESNTKDLLNRHTCQGMLSVSTQSPNTYVLIERNERGVLINLTLYMLGLGCVVLYSS